MKKLESMKSMKNKRFKPQREYLQEKSWEEAWQETWEECQNLDININPESAQSDFYNDHYDDVDPDTDFDSRSRRSHDSHHSHHFRSFLWYFRHLRLLFLGVLICAVFGLVCFWSGRNSVQSANRGNDAASFDRPNAVVLKRRLTEIAQLSTVSYHYTHLARFENSRDFYGVRLPFTTKQFLLTYEGEIKAGIDLKQPQTEVMIDEMGAVSVTLPEAEILSHEIDADSMEIFDEQAGLFNPFTVTDFTSFQASQQALLEKKALEDGLLTQAMERAQETIKLLLMPLLPPDTTLSVQVKPETQTQETQSQIETKAQTEISEYRLDT